jgi:hypothetical protein
MPEFIKNWKKIKNQFSNPNFFKILFLLNFFAAEEVTFFIFFCELWFLLFYKKSIFLFFGSFYCIMEILLKEVEGCIFFLNKLFFI